MTKKTTFRELRAGHRGSEFNLDKHRVRPIRYWNEDYLVVMSYDCSEGFNNLFVYSWKECQNPKFEYTYNMQTLYPYGLFPTAFFLHKHYLVLMPHAVNQSILYGEEVMMSTVQMVRCHDLKQNMKLVGSFDFPPSERNSLSRKFISPISKEAHHLHKMGDYAVALTRLPLLTIHVFSLPDCKLVRGHCLPKQPTYVRTELDQRFLLRDNIMYFWTHTKDFFDDDIDPDQEDIPDEPEKVGQIILVDFDDFLNDTKKNNIEVRVANNWDSPDEYVEKMAMTSIGEQKFVCSLNNGKIVVRQIVKDESQYTAQSVDRLVINPPEPVFESDDEDLPSWELTDGPCLMISRSGDRIAEMRHFNSGRKIYTYDGMGTMLYYLDLDHPFYNLTNMIGYVSYDMDGNFLAAADLNHIHIWNARNGNFIRKIEIPKHYRVKEDAEEENDRYCWKGHADFAFAEDGIIIVHAPRNFPAAADVMLFW